MKNSQAKFVSTRGFLFPYTFNSDGKPIRYLIQTTGGDAYLINADHLLRQMRRLEYQQVFVAGKLKSYLDKEKIINAHKIEKLSERFEEDLYHTIPSHSLEDIVA